ERDHTARDLLAAFMALARDDDEVAVVRSPDGALDCASSVGVDLDLAGHPFQDLADDRIGIFTPRIVRGDDGQVAVLGCDAAHERAFCAVALSATAEDADHTTV